MLRHLWLTPDEAAGLAARLAEHGVEPYRDDSSVGEAYGLLISLCPADIPALPAGDPG